MDFFIFLVQYIICDLKKVTLLFRMERKTILYCISGRKKKIRAKYKDRWIQTLLHLVSSSERIEVQNKKNLQQYLNFSSHQLVLGIESNTIS